MYSQIDLNKRKTILLLVLFCAFAIAMSTIVALSFGFELVDALVAGTFFAVIYSSISYYLSDQITLKVQGAKQIEKQDNWELFNLVENLSITAGIPNPKIYVIEDPMPNAFATGRDPHHASVAITTGLLKNLDKNELQGVLAHEISHIKNFDIRLMTIVVVLIGLIALISNVMLHIGFRSARSKEAKSAAIVFMIIGLIFAILSPIIAQIIQLAISRSREYLADADAALLTRYPEGLANALEKIKNYKGELKKANHATAHLYISNPFGTQDKNKTSWYKKMFSTHPPIDDRIKKLHNMN